MPGAALENDRSSVSGTLPPGRRAKPRCQHADCGALTNVFAVRVRFIRRSRLYDWSERFCERSQFLLSTVTTGSRKSALPARNRVYMPE